MTDNLIRLSIGIEDVDDLIKDIDESLKAIDNESNSPVEKKIKI